jgi:hypothetical protein
MLKVLEFIEFLLKLLILLSLVIVIDRVLIFIIVESNIYNNMKFFKR